jgi:hypothetical protein
MPDHYFIDFMVSRFFASQGLCHGHRRAYSQEGEQLFCQEITCQFANEFAFRESMTIFTDHTAECRKSLEPMWIVIGSMPCFLNDGLGGEAQWSVHHGHLTSTPRSLHFGDSWRHMCMLNLGSLHPVVCVRSRWGCFSVYATLIS